MGVLIVTLIAGALFGFGVFTASVFLCIVFAAMAWMYIAAGLYFKFGFLKCFYHDILGWHRPDKHSKRDICKYCGKDIMQDSQGNWF